MEKKKSRARIVNHVKYGVYIWQLPSGGYLGDSDGNYLSIASEFGDLRKLAILRQAAAAHGFPEGAPVFMPGSRKITDEEYEVQMERMKDGLLPDEYDVGALKDEAIRRHKYGR